MSRDEKTKPVGNSTASTSGRGFRNIVVALDGSKEAEVVLSSVEPLAQAFGAKVTFVCPVVPVVETVAGQMALTEGGMAFGMAEAMEGLRKAVTTEQASYLSRLAEGWTARGVDVICEEPAGRPAEAIVQVARERGADLIAMATPRRGEMRYAELESVADEVIHRSPCAVLLVRS